MSFVVMVDALMVQVGLPFPLVFEVGNLVLEPAHSFIHIPVVYFVVSVIVAGFSLLLKPFQIFAGSFHVLNGPFPNVFQCFSVLFRMCSVEGVAAAFLPSALVPRLA